MAYVRDTYGVPAQRGRIVERYGERGRITYATGYLEVAIPGWRKRRKWHPTDNVVYYNDDGKTVLLDTREGKP